MSSTEVKLLYDFKYVIPGGVNEIVHLKTGEFFILIEEKGEKWLSVKKSGTDEVYYVPVHYVEQFRVSSDPSSSTRLTPPRPPYKPKNLLQRLQNNQDNEPISPPPIDENSYIELYNLLSRKNKEEHVAASASDKKQNNLSQGEHFCDEKSPTEVENIGTISKKDRELKESHQKRAKKIMPVPKPGESSLKVFPNGYEMYRDDISGQVYYYNFDSHESSWILPRVEPRNSSTASTSEATSPSFVKTKTSSEDIFLHKTWQQHGTRSGFLSRTKLTENGGKLKKYWSQVFVVLEGTTLYSFKDQKSSCNKGKSDLTIHLPSSFVLKGGSNNIQNLIHIILSNGTEYLLHSDTPEITKEWFDLLSDVAKRDGELNVDAREGLISYKGISDEKGESQEVDRSDILSKAKRKSGSSTTLDQQSDKTSFKEKLKLWILGRPTQEYLREKGIYKDPIFGSSLKTICKKENTNIPTFITKCIETVEKEGLSVDGIYRVNGNASDIQKLRFAVNQNTPYDLSKLDIHVVTGTLKLFFRELQEPLFPFEHYQPLLDAFGGQNKATDIKSILERFPTENYQTLKELLRHLLMIIQHSNENRMKATNLAIVFGPTLLWPRETCDHDNLAMSLMMRGQLVEFLMQCFSSVFS